MAIYTLGNKLVSVPGIGNLALNEAPIPPLPPTAGDFIDILSPPARVQGGSWYGDTYSGAGISAKGEGSGKATWKWLENEIFGTYGPHCIQIVRSLNTRGYPHGFIEWNASGLSGGLSPYISYYDKYLLVKMLWQPIRNCGRSTYITDNVYKSPWNLQVKLNDIETAKIYAETDGVTSGWSTEYGGAVYTFTSVYADTNQDGMYEQTSTRFRHKFKQLLDLGNGGVSSLFDNNYWTSSHSLNSIKYNNTNNFKLYVSAIGPSAWEGVIPGNQTDWAVESVKLGGFGVSASKLDNISYNDFLSL